VGVAAVEIFRTLGKPGDKVVVNPPVYGSFFHWIEEAELEQVDVPLVQTGDTWQLDLNALEQAFAAGAKFYLLCHPHNPVGKIFSLEELQAIAALAETYGVTVVSDEIHAPLSYAGEKFVPYLNAGQAAAKTGIIITSSSKAWNTAGLKAAIIVSHDAEMAQRLSKLQPDMHWRTSLIGSFAMATAFEEGGTWLDSAVHTIEANFAFMSDQLAQKLPSVQVAKPQNSYLSWWDVSSLGLGSKPAEVILERAKVAVVPGTDLGAGYEQFVRFNFGTSRENIVAAIDAIAAISA
jgi:cystathionine beta-lyase